MVPGKGQRACLRSCPGCCPGTADKYVLLFELPTLLSGVADQHHITFVAWQVPARSCQVRLLRHGSTHHSSFAWQAPARSCQVWEFRHGSTQHRFVCVVCLLLGLLRHGLDICGCSGTVSLHKLYSPFVAVAWQAGARYLFSFCLLHGKLPHGLAWCGCAGTAEPTMKWHGLCLFSFIYLQPPAWHSAKLSVWFLVKLQ